ncbi:MAG: hypothetical protein Q4E17_05175 [Synergistes sp.]|nr:hypothetical protein [Synergistes sp.]
MIMGALTTSTLGKAFDVLEELQTATDVMKVLDNGTATAAKQSSSSLPLVIVGICVLALCAYLIYRKKR